MTKRVILFVLTNVLVVATISVITGSLGLGSFLTSRGIDVGMLLAFCAVWGMGGSFISLLLSKTIAKWTTGTTIIDPEDPREFEWLVLKVHQLSERAGLPRMPEVGVYPSPEVNAFATGPSRGNSLVAVSTGLLQSMSRDEIEGVLGHEVAHIQNGDMVTMTLLQGVVNAFTMFLARVIAFFMTQSLREEDRGTAMVLVTVVLDVLIGSLGYLLVCWFSRQREFRADRGSAVLLGGERKMIDALRALMPMRYDAEPVEEGALGTMKIFGRESRLSSLLSTHPPLQARIAELNRGSDMIREVVRGMPPIGPLSRTYSRQQNH